MSGRIISKKLGFSFNEGDAEIGPSAFNECIWGVSGFALEVLYTDERNFNMS